MDRLVCHFVCMLFVTYLPVTKTVSAFQDPSFQDNASNLNWGKTSLIYFSQSISPSVTFFLEELNKSVEPLQDYGISVTKVNCVEKEVSKYCGHENVYLFRGDLLLRQFPRDTLFDVNAIVANVLFALLFNEVKYITSFADFQNTENAMKGKNNLVFTYVRATGIPEHRAVMEAAFVYGAKYKFFLTTEFSVLAEFEVEELGMFSAVFFFCHCKVVTNFAQPCRRTLLQQSLTTLNIHRYLKLMEAPVVTVINTDPAKASTVHLQLGLPLIIIIGQKNTYEVDKATAEHVAWLVMGKAGVAILLREASNIKIPLSANIALKKAEDGSAIKYLVLEDVNEIPALVEESINEEQMMKYEVDHEDNISGPEQDAQDDQVAEAVYRDRKKKLPLEFILTLTDQTFDSIVTGNSHTVVLFYLSWEAVSMAFLQSYLEVAIKLKEVTEVVMSVVNCGDWPDICSKENITHFPDTRMYFKKQKPLIYSGMLGTEALLRFIILSQKYAGTLLELLPFGQNLNIPNLLSSKHGTTDLVQIVGHELLDSFSEITVENLPAYLRFQKPLLILFSDGNLSHSNQMEMSSLMKGKHLGAFSSGWLNTRNTPVGREILKQYFSSLPDLPVLVLVEMYSNGYVFVFPPDQTITEEHISYWLNTISEGTENPITLLSGKEWTPPFPDYNFLGMMDASMPNFASQKIPIHFSPSGPPKDEKGEHGNTKWEQEETVTSRIGIKGTVPKFTGREKKRRRRLEL